MGRNDKPTDQSVESKPVEYIITTKTSSDFKVGTTDTEVYIQLINTHKSLSSSWNLLDNFFRDDFELGRTDKFKIKIPNIGLPDVIRLKLNKDKDKFGWYCETVTVCCGSSETIFCLFEVVYDEVTARSGEASLPQHENNAIYFDLRRNEVENNKKSFQWHLLPTKDQLGWSLPRYGAAETYPDLPLVFQINDEQIANFRGQRDVVLQNTLLEFGKSLIITQKIKTMNDYQKLFRHPSLPKDMPCFHESWHLDEEFGRQILNGVNTTTIHLCRDIPEEFAKSENEIFTNGVSFKSEIEAKRLYYVSYRGRLNGIKRSFNKSGNPLFCCDPICLLRVGDDKLLRPVAIQLEEGGDVFTPNDSLDDWKLAKMYFRNTDTNVHEWEYHFLRTHAIMEPFAIGLFRSLSRHHPLQKLLRPHLHTIPAINTLARVRLIGPESNAAYSLSLDGGQTAKKAFETLQYEELHIPNLLKKQGTDDENALPYYHYRDDALMLWKVIYKYARDTVSIYYRNDKDVCDDFELAEFTRTVCIDGIAWAGFGTKGFPVKLDTVSELVEYVTIIIFTCSVQHAASNFGQFEIYKFIPNSPAGMRRPPHKKGESNSERIVDTLPDQIMGCLQIGTAYLLSIFSPNEIFLGNFPQKLFQNKEVLKIQEEFRKNLKDASSKIKERNKSLKIPYVYLLPEKIPNYIAV